MLKNDFEQAQEKTASIPLDNLCRFIENAPNCASAILSQCDNLIITNNYGIKNVKDLSKWINPKTQVYMPDKKAPPKYVTKSGRPIYSKKRKYPDAINGKEIVVFLKENDLKFEIVDIKKEMG